MGELEVEELDRYRSIIRSVILEHAKRKVSVGEVENEVIFDAANDHYELIRVGWMLHRRVHGAVIHLDIRGGKVWVQHDATTTGVADEMVEAGIPKDRIVLGFTSPERRQYTDFAVG